MLVVVVNAVVGAAGLGVFCFPLAVALIVVTAFYPMTRVAQFVQRYLQSLASSCCFLVELVLLLIVAVDVARRTHSLNPRPDLPVGLTIVAVDHDQPAFWQSQITLGANAFPIRRIVGGGSASTSR
jgi:hypothetical protein